MTPEDVEALAAPAAADLLQRATAAMAYGLPDPLSLSERFRSEGYDPHLVGLALTQGRLRRKAAERLGPRGARLLWTPDAAEQATRSELAAHRARRLTGLSSVADLGCGAGSDTLAFADAGLRVVAVEQDPATAEVARVNVATEGYADLVDVRLGDVTSTDVTALGCEAAYVDPARRSGGSRRLDAERWSPPWSWVVALAERVPATVAKVAPGIPHDLVPAGAEGEWVSWRGDLKEAAVWHGPLATARRRATLLPSGSSLTEAELPNDVAVGAVGRWLVEPDDAIIRSGLVAAVAAEVDGRLLDPAIAYVVTDTEPVTAFGTAYQVLDAVPFALKRMRAALRAKGYGDVTVKKRGVAVVPEELRRRLALGGGGPMATLVLTRTAAGPLALLVSRRA